MEELKRQVAAAYQEYLEDPFIISRFTSRSLEAWLHQNRDTLTG